MAKQINVSIGGTVKKVSQPYTWVGGVLKKVKKGVCGVGGVVKTFFESELILYDNGTNTAGFVSNGIQPITFGSGNITFSSQLVLFSSLLVNHSNYSKLHIDLTLTTKKQTYACFYIGGDSTKGYDDENDNATEYDISLIKNLSLNTRTELTFDLSNFNETSYMTIWAKTSSGSTGSGTMGAIAGNIYKIWLS